MTMSHATPPLQDSVAPNEASLAGKYLTFALGRENYGIPVLQVREIIRHTAITAVPQMPAYVKGVLNLRGKIIPIVDLRLKFELGSAEVADRTCIVVVQVASSDGNRINTGIIVDGVESVANVAAAQIEPTPDFGRQIDTSYVRAMAKLDGHVVALLDIERVLGAGEVELAGNATPETRR